MLADAVPRLDADFRADLAAIGADGTLTTATNKGLNTWMPVTVDLGEPATAGFAFGSLDHDTFADIDTRYLAFDSSGHTGKFEIEAIEKLRNGEW